MSINNFLGYFLQLCWLLLCLSISPNINASLLNIQPEAFPELVASGNIEPTREYLQQQGYKSLADNIASVLCLVATKNEVKLGYWLILQELTTKEDRQFLRDFAKLLINLAHADCDEALARQFLHHKQLLDIKKGSPGCRRQYFETMLIWVMTFFADPQTQALNKNFAKLKALGFFAKQELLSVHGLWLSYISHNQTLYDYWFHDLQTNTPDAMRFQVLKLINDGPAVIMNQLLDDQFINNWLSALKQCDNYRQTILSLALAQMPELVPANADKIQTINRIAKFSDVATTAPLIPGLLYFVAARDPSENVLSTYLSESKRSLIIRLLNQQPELLWSHNQLGFNLIDAVLAPRVIYSEQELMQSILNAAKIPNTVQSALLRLTAVMLDDQPITVPELQQLLAQPELQPYLSEFMPKLWYWCMVKNRQLISYQILCDNNQPLHDESYMLFWSNLILNSHSLHNHAQNVQTVLDCINMDSQVLKVLKSTINYQDAELGRTALMHAITRGDVISAYWLIMLAQADFSQPKDKLGQTTNQLLQNLNMQVDARLRFMTDLLTPINRPGTITKQEYTQMLTKDFAAIEKLPISHQAIIAFSNRIKPYVLTIAYDEQNHNYYQFENEYNYDKENELFEQFTFIVSELKTIAATLHRLQLVTGCQPSLTTVISQQPTEITQTRAWLQRTQHQTDRAILLQSIVHQQQLQKQTDDLVATATQTITVQFDKLKSLPQLISQMLEMPIKPGTGQ